MITKIDLLGLVNAEMIELDGEPGVFVPFYPNIEYLTSQGRDLALVSIKEGFRPVQRGACSSCGKQIIPSIHRDEALGEDFCNPEVISWTFEGKRKRKTTKATQITRDQIDDAIGKANGGSWRYKILVPIGNAQVMLWIEDICLLINHIAECYLISSMICWTMPGTELVL